MIIEASAPGRAGIVGNPSDIYGGTVVSAALPARAECRLTLGASWHPLDDPTIWDAVNSRFPCPSGRLEWRTTIPRSSGLAGSTALLAATLACVLVARNRAEELRVLADKVLFAELVRDLERHEMAVVCGYQDAYMVVHGGVQRMAFHGKHPTKRGPVGKLVSLDVELPFLLVTTGVERLSGSVHGPIVDRWLKGDEEAQAHIARIGELGEEGAVALVSKDSEALGALMNENQERVAALGGSGEAIDRLVQDCREAGAHGAKLAGAGLGGTVIALHDDPAALEAALREKNYTRFLRPAAEDGLIVRSS